MTQDEQPPGWCKRCERRGELTEVAPGADLCYSCLGETGQLNAYLDSDELERCRLAREEVGSDEPFNTRNGKCPRCGSHFVIERVEREGYRPQEAACCLGCSFVYWPPLLPLILLLSPLFVKRSGTMTCGECGNEWRF